MTRVYRSIAICMIAATFFASASFAQQAVRISPPPMPFAIQAPAGNSVFIKARAVGTQNYICQTSGASFVWKFLGPQATLFLVPDNGRGAVQQVMTHFLSLNPFETGTARPTWQSSWDTSAVWAAVKASSIDPTFVAPGAIPWLLLEVNGAQLGPTGGSFMATTTFIQRLNTSGGPQPATGCSDASHVGNVAFVSYTADYYFYRAE